MGKFNLVPRVLKEQKHWGYCNRQRHAIVENKKISGDVLNPLKIIPF